MSELLERVEIVSDKVMKLFARYFEEVAEVDYLTLFATSEEEQRLLDGEAVRAGTLMGEKNGAVYRLPHDTADSFPTDIVRICNPRETNLLGCADFVATDYTAIRSQASTQLGFTEMHKVNHGIEYDIIELTDPKLRVAIYLPSIRMLGSVIELSTE